MGQAESLKLLAWLLYDDKRLSAAEEAVTRAIGLLPEKGQEYKTSQCNKLLGDVYRSKGERGKAIHHYEVALEIASPFNWHDRQFWIHHSLAQLFRDENDFNDANVHIERAKSHTVGHEYLLARAMELQAQVWDREGRLEDASSEALRAKEIYEKLGLAKDVQDCIDFLREIEQAEEEAHL